MRLLLISNSTGPDGGYLDWCEPAITAFAGDARRVLFVPFAGTDERGYGETAVRRLTGMGFEADWLDRSTAGPPAVAAADIVFVGGGNTFLLLDRLIATGVGDAIRAAVHAGLPYIGTSAGTNVAGPTIKTTNDMPIVQPPTFDALGLIPYQINPHYLDPDPSSTHQGETREQRILEFVAVDPTPVVALREGAWLDVANDEIALGGATGARVFRRGFDPLEIVAGTRLDELPGMVVPAEPDTATES